ncbi:MAG TPA: DUF5668 domain-containing protein [Thermomicrobiales bacterium]|jgi:hypothetical protein|nr:DUF5668 domain-containing protein [Thermomicrobiales bacterium]
MGANRGTHTRDGVIGGIVLVLIGTLFLVQELFNIDVWRYAWPLVLIAIGIGILVRRGLPSSGPDTLAAAPTGEEKFP